MDAAAQEVLLFEVGGQRYGLPALQVQEIVRAVTMVPLHQGTAALAGVINLRGDIVPVIDLRPWFGLSGRAVEPADHLIIVVCGEQRAALHVDRVTELVPAQPAAVQDAMLETKLNGQAWIAKIQDEVVLVYEPQVFLMPAAAARGTP